MNQTNESVMLTKDKVEAMKAEMQSGQYVHQFREAVEWKGKTYASLSFDFESLRGRDALAIEAEMNALGIHAAVRKFDMNYQMRIASRACAEPLGTDFYIALPMRDYENILSRAQGFLLMLTKDKVEAMKAEMQSGQYVHQFREAVEWKGKTYASLSFDFASLRGGDALAIEAEMNALGIHAAVRKFDMNYQMRVASRACAEPLGTDFFEALPMRDFENILSRVQGFLLRAE